MPGKFYPRELKNEIVERIKSEGKPVSQIASEYGVHVKTVYGWLRSKTVGDTSALELNRLKRENKELLEIVGMLTRDLNRGKKG